MKGLNRQILMVFILTSLGFSFSASAALLLRVGPYAAGSGGPNPISIPPTNPAEYELVWLTSDKKEWSLGITPGVFLYGQRFAWEKGLYASAGVGYILSFKGGGMGVYSAFGWEFCPKGICHIEYKQALGWLPGQGLVSPYAVRLGMTVLKL